MWENIKKRRKFYLSYSGGGIGLFIIYLFLHFFTIYDKVDYYSLSFYERKSANILFSIKFMGILFFCFGILKYIIYTVSIYKNKKMLLEFEKYLNDSDYMYSDNLKLYVTKKYVLDFMKDVNIYDISDILWVYPEKNIHKSRNGKTIGTSCTIVFMLKNGKFFPSMSYLYRGDDIEKINEIIEFVKKNNSNVRVNYNDENIKYFKDKGFKSY